MFLNRDATVRRACDLIAEAAGAGARIIAFPESFIPGYPGWIFGAASWESPIAKRLHAQLAANTLDVGSPALAALRTVAREHEITVVMGATERDAAYSRGSLYNSLFFISATGELLGVHRKLIPTHAERIIWTPAPDGSTLRCYETPVGRVGGLLCWEHWMPLSRYVLHAAGEQIHVAAWPDVSEHHQLASRHYAFEGRCYVLCSGQLLRSQDLPDDAELLTAMQAGGDFADGLLLPGGAGIIAPDGSWLAGPAGDEPTILYADVEPERIIEEQLALDTAGHYQRSDIFTLTVDSRPRPPVRVTTLDSAPERTGD